MAAAGALLGLFEGDDDVEGFTGEEPVVPPPGAAVTDTVIPTPPEISSARAALVPITVVAMAASASVTATRTAIAGFFDLTVLPRRGGRSALGLASTGNG